MKGEKMRQKGV